MILANLLWFAAKVSKKFEEIISKHELPEDNHPGCIQREWGPRWPKSPLLESRHTVENLQMELLHSLRLELKHNHPREKLIFPRLLVLIPQLVQTAEIFRQSLKNNIYDVSRDFSNIHPLFVEIFELL
ncbi:hypothetical protein CHS0354_032717 [Potamilus streckersoni]|uniref:Uncharacterized protein n=1 Tax=Potamilus streckersoni TaxID=2493646 RepID=A0AAE0RR32_9BIVA|nr:hypothetical protein CHS0354_032717 [Potamilus streckersoni]